jgi:hypothetical protein
VSAVWIAMSTAATKNNPSRTRALNSGQDSDEQIEIRGYFALLVPISTRHSWKFGPEGN